MCGGGDVAMKKFIEEDIVIDKGSPINFFKSILLLVISAPAKFLLTITTKMIYLPKQILERVLLFSLMISCVVTIGGIALDLFFGVFTIRSVFTVACIITTMFFVITYFIFTVGTLTIYEQMSSLIRKSDDEINKEEASIVQDLTEEHEISEEVTEVECSVGVKPVSTEQNSSIIPEFESLDDLFSEDSNDSANVKEESLLRPLSSVVEEIENSGKCGNKQLVSTEIENLLQRMHVATEESKYVTSKFLESLGKNLIVVDDFNLGALDVGVIPNGFKALC